MAIEDLREIGNVLYERRSDGMLYPVRRVRPDTEARGVPAQDPSLLNVGGIGERLAFLNQTFNPVEGIGSAMRAGSRMVAPDQSYWDRISALGEMASGVASIAAPIAAARSIGVPAASAMMEGLLGGSPTTQAAGDMARRFAVDESGAFRLYQGSPHNFNAERLVRYPDGRTEYIVGRPDVLPDVPAGAEVLQDFPLGRQRMDKIGTGEGAQAYGYGLYGAEAEGIARGYRDALSDPDAVPLQFDGRPVNTPWNTEIRERWPEYFSGLSEGDADAMEELLGNLSQVNNMDDIPGVLGGVSSRARTLYSRVVKPKLVKPDVGAGRMYELNINANPEDFINYDAPLSAQSQRVKETFGYTPKPTPEDEIAAFEIAKRETPNDIGGHPAVQGIYNRQSASDAAERLFQRQVQGGGIDDAARISLSEAGIPGIRYLDAGSRGAGDGSRNYVIFDENLIEIVRKYGIAGAAAMLGVSAVDVEEAIAQGAPPSQWDQLVVGPQ
jgi:hypothetical protein